MRKLSVEEIASLSQLALLNAEQALKQYEERISVSGANPRHKDNTCYLLCARLNLKDAKDGGLDIGTQEKRLINLINTYNLNITGSQLVS